MCTPFGFELSKKFDHIQGEGKENVRFWPLADMGWCAAHVCFQEHSGHDRLPESARAVAIGSKADMTCCAAYVGL